MAVCKARRAEYERRWRALGPPAVGREERLFKVSNVTLDLALPSYMPPSEKGSVRWPKARMRGVGDFLENGFGRKALKSAV